MEIQDRKEEQGFWGFRGLLNPKLESKIGKRNQDSRT